jgi:hypothetical protein
MRGYQKDPRLLNPDSQLDIPTILPEEAPSQISRELSARLSSQQRRPLKKEADSQPLLMEKPSSH